MKTKYKPAEKVSLSGFWEDKKERKKLRKQQNEK